MVTHKGPSRVALDDNLTISVISPVRCNELTDRASYCTVHYENTLEWSRECQSLQQLRENSSPVFTLGIFSMISLTGLFIYLTRQYGCYIIS